MVVVIVRGEGSDERKNKCKNQMYLPAQKETEQGKKDSFKPLGRGDCYALLF